MENKLKTSVLGSIYVSDKTWFAAFPSHSNTIYDIMVSNFQNWKSAGCLSLTPDVTFQVCLRQDKNDCIVFVASAKEF